MSISALLSLPLLSVLEDRQLQRLRRLITRTPIAPTLTPMPMAIMGQGLAITVIGRGSRVIGVMADGGELGFQGIGGITAKAWDQSEVVAWALVETNVGWGV